MIWNQQKILVTGAGGFIGSHLCEALVDLGADVTAMIRYTSRSDLNNLDFLPAEKKNRLKIAAGNIEDSDFVGRQVQGKTMVFHLAALIGIPYSYIAPRSYVRTNVEGTLNVMESAHNFGVEKVVHTSTSETYGTALYTPIDEKHALQGQSPYSASKISADKLVESYFRSFDLPVATVRPFNTYGPRQSARAVIPTIIAQALTEKTIRLGSLEPIRDLTYVSDIVQGFLLIGEKPQSIGQTINLGSGSGITIAELTKVIFEILGHEREVVQDRNRVRPEKSEVLTLICDNTRALTLLGWKPRHSLKEGLMKTIKFISDHPGLFRASSYTV